MGEVMSCTEPTSVGERHIFFLFLFFLPFLRKSSVARESFSLSPTEVGPVQGITSVS